MIVLAREEAIERFGKSQPQRVGGASSRRVERPVFRDRLIAVRWSDSKTVPATFEQRSSSGIEPFPVDDQLVALPGLERRTDIEVGADLSFDAPRVEVQGQATAIGVPQLVIRHYECAADCFTRRVDEADVLGGSASTHRSRKLDHHAKNVLGNGVMAWMNGDYGRRWCELLRLDLERNLKPWLS